MNPTTTVSNLIISGDVQEIDFVERDNDELTNTLKQFWETESIGICNWNEQHCDEFKPLFPREIRRAGDKYEVKLPWKKNRAAHQ